MVMWQFSKVQANWKWGGTRIPEDTGEMSICGGAINDGAYQTK
jgi:hypothetical protein